MLTPAGMMNDGLPYYICRHDGFLMARTHFSEDAAAMVALLGDGATIRFCGYVVWTEGEDNDGLAGESYDTVADTIGERIRNK